MLGYPFSQSPVPISYNLHHISFKNVYVAKRSISIKIEISNTNALLLKMCNIDHVD